MGGLRIGFERQLSLKQAVYNVVFDIPAVKELPGTNCELSSSAQRKKLYIADVYVNMMTESRVRGLKGVIRSCVMCFCGVCKGIQVICQHEDCRRQGFQEFMGL
ncbi:LOW QUALITY PROTEIN: hypothetical protein HID58_091771 [Brassica napus]|uniref:Uncharacterized protein n=1 Tax=Brassica napus TaxID=3708 RepID=A0ABQ7WYQ6_BRANA|nr:LOW QUALITY PROTEIN: hypothetical protein HID58_091771 [Brassica napus]